MSALTIILLGIGIGVVLGFLARLIGSTILIGFFAAIAGGFVADGFGWGYDDGWDWPTFLIQIAVAVVIVAVFHIPRRNRAA